jgi:hypothetical protein
MNKWKTNKFTSQKHPKLNNAHRMWKHVDMVDGNTSKQVSPTNPHVPEATPQVLRTTNYVSKVWSLELQALKAQASKAQVLKVQVLDIETS